MENSRVIYTFRDYVIDFFGKLMPGTLFIVFGLIALAWPIYALIAKSTVTLITAAIREAPKLSQLIDAIWVPFTIFVLFLAYSLGHMFYRSDIKTPDTISLKRALANSQAGDTPQEDLACDEIEPNEFKYGYLKRMGYFLVNGVSSLVKSLVSPRRSKVSQCEYPYVHLRKYLNKRGLAEYVSGLIPWDGGSNRNLRSKNYIDILKIRICKHAPELYMEIARNEAHVRLSSSIWHAARALQWASGFGVVIVMASIYLRYIASASPVNEAYINFYIAHSVPPVIVILISAYCRSVVTGFLHTQRIREAVYVIEIAHSVFKDKPHEIQDIFPNYNPLASGKEDQAVGDENLKTPSRLADEGKWPRKLERNVLTHPRVIHVTAPFSGKFEMVNHSSGGIGGLVDENLNVTKGTRLCFKEEDICRGEVAHVGPANGDSKKMVGIRFLD